MFDGTALLALLGVLASWEILAPRRSLTIARRLRWPTNIALGCFNMLLAQSRVTALAVAAVAADHRWGLLNLLEVPSVVSIVVAIVVIDLLHYAEHRVLHAVPLLWRVHRVHHAERELDYTTGFRFHPLEVLAQSVVYAGVVALLGLPPAGVIAYAALAIVSTLVTHGNGRVPRGLERALGWLLVTPDMHRIHHSARALETDSNYATVLSVWDRLFGTYRAASRERHETMTFGLTEFADAKYLTVPWTFALPFLPARRAPGGPPRLPTGAARF